jgi:hypothetical protein
VTKNKKILDPPSIENKKITPEIAEFEKMVMKEKLRKQVLEKRSVSKSNPGSLNGSLVSLEGI